MANGWHLRHKAHSGSLRGRGRGDLSPVGPAGLWTAPTTHQTSPLPVSGPPQCLLRRTQWRRFRFRCLEPGEREEEGTGGEPRGLWELLGGRAVFRADVRPAVAPLRQEEVHGRDDDFHSSGAGPRGPGSSPEGRLSSVPIFDSPPSSSSSSFVSGVLPGSGFGGSGAGDLPVWGSAP